VAGAERDALPRLISPITHGTRKYAISTPTIRDLRSRPKGILFLLTEFDATDAGNAYAPESATNENEENEGTDNDDSRRVFRRQASHITAYGVNRVRAISVVHCSP
jgi:hypothetical protein